MSGVTVAVGPGGEASQAVVGGVMGSLRVIELQLVAFIMVFSASGLVPLTDLLFPAVASSYLLSLSRLSFPVLGQAHRPAHIVSPGPLFRAHVVLGTVLGLFLPLAFVLGGFARGDETAVRSATPHLFLLSFQILTENVVSGLAIFSPPVRAFIPLLYTVRRLFLLLDWTKEAWVGNAASLPPNAHLKDVAWYWFGKYLAIANLVYFSVNLFVFLIPKFLPRAFETYFRERDELHAKISHDRPVSSSQPSDVNKLD